jgi:hypothetical protein
MNGSRELLVECNENGGESNKEMIQLSQQLTNKLDSSNASLGESRGNGNGNRIVEIYAAYDSGLYFGACVRLQISNETTSKQIVELMIRKLGEEFESKLLSPAAAEDCSKHQNIEEFCLGKIYY